MIVAVWVPLVVSVALAMLAGPAARRLPPGIGVWAMVATAVAVTVSGLWSLALLAGLLLDDVPWISVGRSLTVVPDPISALAAAALAVCAIRCVRAAHRLGRDVDALRALSGGDDELVVATDAGVEAFAVGARWLSARGTVYVSTGMLALLDPSQQRVLLAHERAHLRSRHGAARFSVAICAAANPLLIPVREAVAYLCERHADEVAAATTGSRKLVARTVAVAALARSSTATVAPALHRLAVTDRVAALLGKPPVRRHRALVILGAATIIISSAAMLDATTDFTHFVRML